MSSSASSHVDALELARALGAAADGRVEQAIVAVDALAEAPDLGADVAVGDVVLGRAVDLGDAPAAHRDVERAGIGAVERARGV